MNDLTIREIKGLLHLTLSGEEHSATLRFDPWEYLKSFDKALDNKPTIFDAKNGKIIFSKNSIHFCQNPTEFLYKGEDAVRYFLQENEKYFKKHLKHYSH